MLNVPGNRNSIGGVMASVLASSTVDRGFDGSKTIQLVFVAVKLIIVLSVQHYMGRVIADRLHIMYDIYSFHIYVVIHKLNIKLQK